MRHSLHPDPAVPFRTSCNDCELDRIFCVYWLLLPRLELVFWKYIARRVGPPGSQSQRCGAVRCRRGHAARANILAFFFFLSFFSGYFFIYLRPWTNQRQGRLAVRRGCLAPPSGHAPLAWPRPPILQLLFPIIRLGINRDLPNVSCCQQYVADRAFLLVFQIPITRAIAPPPYQRSQVFFFLSFYFFRKKFLCATAIFKVVNGVGVGPRPRSAVLPLACSRAPPALRSPHNGTRVGWRGEVKIIFRLHLLLQAVPIGVIQEELTSEIRSLQAVQLALGNGKAQNQQFSPIYAPFRFWFLDPVSKSKLHATSLNSSDPLRALQWPVRRHRQCSHQSKV